MVNTSLSCAFLGSRNTNSHYKRCNLIPQTALWYLEGSTTREKTGPVRLAGWNGPKMWFSTCTATCSWPVLLREKANCSYHFSHHFSKQPLQPSFPVWTFPWRQTPHHSRLFTKQRRVQRVAYSPHYQEPWKSWQIELSGSLMSLEIKGECGRLKNMLVLYQYFKRLS